MITLNFYNYDEFSQFCEDAGYMFSYKGDNIYEVECDNSSQLIKVEFEY